MKEIYFFGGLVLFLFILGILWINFVAYLDERYRKNGPKVQLKFKEEMSKSWLSFSWFIGAYLGRKARLRVRVFVTHH